MAWYSLFVLKVLLNINQQTKLQFHKWDICYVWWYIIVLWLQAEQSGTLGSAGVDTQPERAEYGPVAAKQWIKPRVTRSDGTAHCTWNTDGTSPAVSQLVGAPPTRRPIIQSACFSLRLVPQEPVPRIFILLVGSPHHQGMAAENLNCCILIWQCRSSVVCVYWVFYYYSLQMSVMLDNVVAVSHKVMIDAC